MAKYYKGCEKGLMWIWIKKFLAFVDWICFAVLSFVIKKGTDLFSFDVGRSVPDCYAEINQGLSPIANTEINQGLSPI